ncbi:hypothetical protein BHE74_00033355 [Ensete ventricosum]|nr:hypothetical protein BHE74_00033355 [Ensete ventricosum]RZS19284.1 hypothetical protein BHM03_00051658 [Ensete ventricosum]
MHKNNGGGGSYGPIRWRQRELHTRQSWRTKDKDDDINETNLDLNLGLKTTDGDRETKSRNTKLDEGDQPVKASTSRGAATKTTTNSETHNKLKRKAVPLTLK